MKAFLATLAVAIPLALPGWAVERQRLLRSRLLSLPALKDGVSRSKSDENGVYHVWRTIVPGIFHGWGGLDAERDEDLAFRRPLSLTT
jgi:hypothetical protein